MGALWHMSAWLRFFMSQLGKLKAEYACNARPNLNSMCTETMLLMPHGRVSPPLHIPLQPHMALQVHSPLIFPTGSHISSPPKLLHIEKMSIYMVSVLPVPICPSSKAFTNGAVQAWYLPINHSLSEAAHSSLWARNPTVI